MADIIQKLILVADDDALNREIMEALLTYEKHNVILAHNGQTAIDKALHENPDLIILDVKMSDINGYDVCKRLRSDAHTQATPIMIVTGYDSAEDRHEALSVGADLFYPRPFDSDDFIVQVSRLLEV